MKKTARGVRKRFLVAQLCPPPGRNGKPLPAQIQQSGSDVSNALVDSRMAFLKGCQDMHWQFDELKRAQYSTMMMLAILGGSPPG